MSMPRIRSGLAISALGLLGAIGANIGTEPIPRHTRDSHAGSDSVSGNAGVSCFLRGSLDMICLSDRPLEGGPFATPETYRSSGHDTVEKLTWNHPSGSTWKRGRSANAIEAAPE